MKRVGKFILFILVIVIVLECVFLIKGNKDREVGYFVYNEEGCLI